MTLIDKREHRQLLDSLDGFKHAKACGGSAANSIAAAQLLGARTFYSCRVAKDDIGQFFHDGFTSRGVKTNLDHNGHCDEGITGKCIVLLTPDAERTMCTFLGVADTYTENDIDEEALKNSKYLYAEGYSVTSEPSTKSVKHAFKIARENGVKTSIALSDPNIAMHFRDGLKDMMSEPVDILFSNQEEALIFADTRDLDEAVETLKRYAKTFAITLGSKGSMIFDGKDTHHCPRHPITVVDTLGAGDTFAGTFLYALSQDYSYHQAGKLANIAAGTLVSKFGPRIDAEDAKKILEIAENEPAVS
jgi:sugar/nucleoside kinase (ribokinase family)